MINHDIDPRVILKNVAILIFKYDIISLKIKLDPAAVNANPKTRFKGLDTVRRACDESQTFFLVVRNAPVKDSQKRVVNGIINVINESIKSDINLT